MMYVMQMKLTQMLQMMCVCDVDEVDVNEVGDVKDTGEMDMMNLIRCSVDAKDVGNAMQIIEKMNLAAALWENTLCRGFRE